MSERLVDLRDSAACAPRVVTAKNLMKGSEEAPLFEKGLIDAKECFTVESVNLFIAHQLLTSNVQEQKTMSDLEKDYKAVSEHADGLAKVLDKSITNFTEKREKVEKESKVTAGKLKDAAEKALQGVERLEKMASLEKLERINTVLGEIAVSLEKLERIQKTGMLDKILSAVKS